MIKHKILEILELNKELIKNTFGIDEIGIDKLKNFLSKDYDDFKDIVHHLFVSEMGNREKMTLFYLIGYANGKRVKNDISGKHKPEGGNNG